MVEEWKKSQEILDEAKLRSEKCYVEILKLLEQDLTQENYKKIKQLLDKDSSICTKAFDAAQKIRQNEIQKELDDKI